MRNKRVIKIEELIKYSVEDFEDLNDFECYIQEAAATKALEFFHIFYDEKTKALTFDSNIDTDRALKILELYTTIVNEDVIKQTLYYEEAVKYDNYTKEYRGADDGTFDYAGSYVQVILLTIQAYLKAN